MRKPSLFHFIWPSITFSQTFHFFPCLKNQMGQPFTVCQVVKMISSTSQVNPKH